MFCLTISSISNRSLKSSRALALRRGRRWLAVVWWCVVRWYVGGGWWKVVDEEGASKGREVECDEILRTPYRDILLPYILLFRMAGSLLTKTYVYPSASAYPERLKELLPFISNPKHRIDTKALEDRKQIVGICKRPTSHPLLVPTISVRY